MALNKQWADSSVLILFLGSGASLVFITSVAEERIRKYLMYEVRGSMECLRSSGLGQKLLVKMIWKGELSVEDNRKTSKELYVASRRRETFKI